MPKPCRALVRTALVGAWAISGVLFGTGCDEKPHAEPSHALPPLEEHAAPTAQPHTAVHDPVDPLEGNPHGGAEPSADPHGATPEAMTPGDIPFDKATVIAGSLKLDAKTQGKVKAGDTIFVVVRGIGDGATPGPVLAVRRLDAGTFPMQFQVDSRDAMIAGTALKPPVQLSARVDKDGDAITKNPGDVVGNVTLKKLPAERVALVLDTVL